MAKELRQASHKVYWLTWLVLLVLTVIMVFVSRAPMPRLFLLALLVLAMLAKASLIGGYFMHLRFEKRSLILVVVLGILVTACVLFFGIAPDGLRILELSLH